MKLLTTKYQVTKNFLLLGILVTGLLSAIIGVLAFFGQNMGTFVISLGDDVYRTGIILSDNKEFTTSSPRLLVNPVNNAVPVAYDDLEIEKAMATDGDYVDSRKFTYIAYTFYLKNEGNTIVDVEFDIEITTMTKNIDSACRVMLIQDDDLEHLSIYRKADSNPINYYDHTPYELSKDFESSSRVCTNTFESFRPGNVKKYTLFIWLEGWDEDCDNSIMGGQLRMNMTFNIVKSIQDED
jgi:ABC-type antimicrobial peptide transport system permease subunit